MKTLKQVLLEIFANAKLDTIYKALTKTMEDRISIAVARHNATGRRIVLSVHATVRSNFQNCRSEPKRRLL